MKHKYLENSYHNLEDRYPNETEYLQAVHEVLTSVDTIIDDYPDYVKYNVVERLLEPERIILFKVTWMDDQKEIHVNRGYRVQYSSLIGTYKGGLRFHPSVNMSILKFLAFEQTFKNALTTLPMGGAKGGSDFNPKGRSDDEIMRFCQAFMSELYRHIGEDLDIPAGDIGVGKREIGYLYGSYKKITNQVTGSITGKGTTIGGSHVRKEATGYGLAYFVEEALKTIKNTSFKDKKVIISGSGNVAIYAAEKVIELGGIVIAMSDSSGYILCEHGVDLEVIKEIKEIKRACIDTYPSYDAKGTYVKDPQKMWTVKADIALPCATQNELDEPSVQHLIDHNIMMVAEGANMPTTPKGIELLRKHNILFAPGKAANAGGVYVSGLEIAQNASFNPWTFDKVDQKLKEVMKQILHDIYDASKRYDKENDLLFGANVVGFKKVARAMIQQGLI